MENDQFYEDSPDRSYEEDRQEDSYGFEEMEPAEPKPKKKKKKRTFKRVMRGLGRYIANMPAQTLVFIGGGIVVVLVAVILLVVLLPKNKLPAEEPNADNQLSIQDAATPTPTLPPIATPGPTAEPSATPGVTIKEGGLLLWDVDDVIASIQEQLVKLGYMEMPEGGYTTKYGPATKNGIRRFQQRNFESTKDWDGICGQKTYDLLMSEDVKAFWIKTGDTDDSLYDGERVTKLQTRLVELKYMTDKPTGTYGKTTAAAIQQFQADNGLVADGIAGQATLNLIYSDTAVDAATAKLRGTPSAAVTPAAGTAAASTSPEAGTSPDAAAAAATAVTAPPSVTAEPNPTEGVAG